MEYTSDDEVFFGPVTTPELRARKKKGLDDLEKTLRDFSFHPCMSDDDYENVSTDSEKRGAQPSPCIDTLPEYSSLDISGASVSPRDSLENLEGCKAPVSRKRKRIASTPMNNDASFSSDSLDGESLDEEELCDTVHEPVTHENFKGCFISPSKNCPAKTVETLMLNDDLLPIAATNTDDDGEIVIDLKSNDSLLFNQKMRSVIKDNSHNQDEQVASTTELLKSSVLDFKAIQNSGNADSVAALMLDSSLLCKKPVENEVNEYSIISTASTVLFDMKTDAEEQQRFDDSNLLSVSTLSALTDSAQAEIIMNLETKAEDTFRTDDFEEENVNLASNIVDHQLLMQSMEKSSVETEVQTSDILDEEVNAVQNIERCENIPPYEIAGSNSNTPSQQQSGANNLKDSGFHDVSAIASAKASPCTPHFEMHLADNITNESVSLENSDSGADTSTDDCSLLEMSSLTDTSGTTLEISINILGQSCMYSIDEETSINLADAGKPVLHSAEDEIQLRNENILPLKSYLSANEGEESETFAVHEKESGDQESEFENDEYSEIAQCIATEEHNASHEVVGDEMVFEEAEKEQHILTKDEGTNVFSQSDESNLSEEKTLSTEEDMAFDSSNVVQEFENEDPIKHISVLHERDTFVEVEMESHDIAVTQDESTQEYQQSDEIVQCVATEKHNTSHEVEGNDIKLEEIGEQHILTKVFSQSDESNLSREKILSTEEDMAFDSSNVVQEFEDEDPIKHKSVHHGKDTCIEVEMENHNIAVTREYQQSDEIVQCVATEKHNTSHEVEGDEIELEETEEQHILTKEEETNVFSRSDESNLSKEKTLSTEEDMAFDSSNVVQEFEDEDPIKHKSVHHERDTCIEVEMENHNIAVTQDESTQEYEQSDEIVQRVATEKHNTSHEVEGDEIELEETEEQHILTKEEETNVFSRSDESNLSKEKTLSTEEDMAFDSSNVVQEFENEDPIKHKSVHHERDTCIEVEMENRDIAVTQDESTQEYEQSDEIVQHVATEKHNTSHEVEGDEIELEETEEQHILTKEEETNVFSRSDESNLSKEKTLSTEEDMAFDSSNVVQEFENEDPIKHKSVHHERDICIEVEMENHDIAVTQDESTQEYEQSDEIVQCVATEKHNTSHEVEDDEIDFEETEEQHILAKEEETNVFSQSDESNMLKEKILSIVKEVAFDSSNAIVQEFGDEDPIKHKSVHHERDTCIEVEMENHDIAVTQDESTQEYQQGDEIVQCVATEKYNTSHEVEGDEMELEETEEEQHILTTEEETNVFSQSDEYNMLKEKILSIAKEVVFDSPNAVVQEFEDEDPIEHKSVHHERDTCIEVEMENHDITVTQDDSIVKMLDTSQNKSSSFILNNETYNDIIEEHDTNNENVLAEDSVISCDVNLLQEGEIDGLNVDKQEDLVFSNEIIVATGGAKLHENVSVDESGIDSADTTQEFGSCDGSAKWADSGIDSHQEIEDENNISQQLSSVEKSAVADGYKSTIDRMQEPRHNVYNYLFDELHHSHVMKDTVNTDKVVENIANNILNEENVGSHNVSSFTQKLEVSDISEVNEEFKSFETSHNISETRSSAYNSVHEITLCAEQLEVSAIRENTECERDLRNEDCEMEDSVMRSDSICNQRSFQGEDQSLSKTKNEDLGLTKLIHDFELNSRLFEDSELHESNLIQNCGSGIPQSHFKYADFSIAKEITIQDGSCFIQEHDVLEKETKHQLNTSELSLETGDSTIQDANIQVDIAENSLFIEVVDNVSENLPSIHQSADVKESNEDVVLETMEGLVQEVTLSMDHHETRTNETAHHLTTNELNSPNNCSFTQEPNSVDEMIDDIVDATAEDSQSVDVYIPNQDVDITVPDSCNLAQEFNDDAMETTKEIVNHGIESSLTAVVANQPIDEVNSHDSFTHESGDNIIGVAEKLIGQVETLLNMEFDAASQATDAHLQDNSSFTQETANYAASESTEEVIDDAVVVPEGCHMGQIVIEVDVRDTVSSLLETIEDGATKQLKDTDATHGCLELNDHSESKIISKTAVFNGAESQNFNSQAKTITCNANIDDADATVRESSLLIEEVESNGLTESQPASVFEVDDNAEKETSHSAILNSEADGLQNHSSTQDEVQDSDCADESLQTKDLVNATPEDSKLPIESNAITECNDVSLNVFSQDLFFEQDEIVSLKNGDDHEEAAKNEQVPPSLNKNDEDSLAFNHFVRNEAEVSLSVSFFDSFEKNLKIYDDPMSASYMEQKAENETVQNQKIFSADFIDNFSLQPDNLRLSKAFDFGVSQEALNTPSTHHSSDEQSSLSQSTIIFEALAGTDEIKIQDKSSKSVDISGISNTCTVDEFSFNEENRLQKLKELSVNDLKNSSFISNSSEPPLQEDSILKNGIFDEPIEMAKDALDERVSSIEKDFEQEKAKCLLEVSAVSGHDGHLSVNGTHSSFVNKDFPLVCIQSPCVSDDKILPTISPLQHDLKHSNNYFKAGQSVQSKEEVNISLISLCSSNPKSCNKLLKNSSFLLQHTPNGHCSDFSSSSLFNSDSKLHEGSFDIAEITQLLNNTCSTSLIEDEVLFNNEECISSSVAKMPVASMGNGTSLLPLSDVIETEVRSARKGSHITMRPSSTKRYSSTKRTVKVIDMSGMVSEILNSGSKLYPSTATIEEPVFTNDVKKKLFETDMDFIEGEELDLVDELDTILARMSSSPVKKCESSKSEKSVELTIKTTPLMKVKKADTPVSTFKKPVQSAKPHVPSSASKENIPVKKTMPRFGISKTPNEKPKKTSEFLTKSLNPPRFCKKTQVEEGSSAKKGTGTLKKPTYPLKIPTKIDKKIPAPKMDLTNTKPLTILSKSVVKSLPQDLPLKPVTKSRFGFCPGKGVASSLPKTMTKNITPKKYLNVQSPVGKYIQESPVPPLIKIVKADKKPFTMPKTIEQPVKKQSRGAWEAAKSDSPILPPAKYTTKTGNQSIIKTTPVKPKSILKLRNIPAPVVTKHIGSSKVVEGCNYLANEESLLETSLQSKTLKPPTKYHRDMDATLVHEVDIIHSNTLVKSLKKVK